MNLNTLSRQFEAIGATLTTKTVEELPRRGPLSRSAQMARSEGFALDILPSSRPGNRSQGESYLLTLRPDAEETVDLLAIDIAPRRRHLLLLAKPIVVADAPVPPAERRKFLCGHDERHWFVAAIPNASGVTSIVDAMERLKPPAARLMQKRNGVRVKDWNSRANAGFVRQGEWFFLPVPDFAPPSTIMVLRDEPIRRGAGKPHWVEELYRDGGQTVYVSSKYPYGLLESQYKRLLERQPSARNLNWQIMRRNPSVYARGKIRHADHATITLPFWHQVLMSSEETGVRSVAFLD